MFTDSLKPSVFTDSFRTLGIYWQFLNPGYLLAVFEPLLFTNNSGIPSIYRQFGTLVFMVLEPRVFTRGFGPLLFIEYFGTFSIVRDFCKPLLAINIFKSFILNDNTKSPFCWYRAAE